VTPSDFSGIRDQSGLTQNALAKGLRTDLRTVQRYEAGERAISGPVQVLMRLLDSGIWKP